MAGKSIVKQRIEGFSLIELMIVVAIIALLAMVAYPSYMETVRETRRTEGIALINKVMQAQERHFINNLTYTTDLTDLGMAVATNLPSENGHYQISAAACAGGLPIDECINVVATAQGSQAVEGNLGLTSRGEKTGSWQD